MRKRLIERIRKRGSLGYTLTELLTVIGIIAVVCAIAIPSIFAIRSALRFAQANNYAKSIFLAAQQNLTEMRSDGGLEPVQSAGGAQSIPSAVTTFPDEFRTEYVYTTTGTQAFDRVLPAASIDASIRDDQIIIEYNPLTGNVYAVFYYDKTDLDLDGTYAGGTLPRDKAERKRLMVGYYDGSGLNSSQIELEQTQAIVNFENGQEGIVQVMVPLPESFYGKHSDFGKGLDITLSISGDQSMAAGSSKQPLSIPIEVSTDTFAGKLSDDGKSLIFEFPIDSLANRSSFVNYASNTQATAPGAANSGSSLTTLTDETRFGFNVLPGENITITANVEYVGTGSEMVQIAPGILSGVNPMFEYLQPDGGSGYVLAVSNGRNLQNLNAIAPSIAQKVSSVVFTSDINWSDTVTYYNKTYNSGSTYYNTTKVSGVDVYDEAPARALPYFVPIHNADLFGTASFEYGVASWVEKVPDGIIKDILLLLFDSNDRVPTLTDEFDTATHAAISGDDVANGDAAQVYYLNIDTTKYPVTKAFYAGTDNTDNDRFTGLFSYVNTSIDNIHIVNPIIKGYYFVDGTDNNPATGALVGCAGYNAYISNCAVYLDKSDSSFIYGKMTSQSQYSKTISQGWYGVSGEGAVGGLVGYAKSHRTTTGALTADKDVLAFYNSFAAVNVSGNLHKTQRNRMTGSVVKYYDGYKKDYGYSTGIGGFIGNSELTNFYNCYASGNVMATNVNAAASYESKSIILNFLNSMAEWFGLSVDFQFNGRESCGAGGFVGTSHGTRYTNCFATGEVSATNTAQENKTLGAGAFVGAMCIDETFAYGNQNDSEITSATYAQRTVFTNCYSAGLVYVNSTVSETFSGATCRVAADFTEFATAQVADYYRLLAPHYVLGSELGPNAQKNQLPSYEDFYIYKDSYYLSNYLLDKPATNSNNCASPIDYPTLQNLPGNHQNMDWITTQIGNIKKIKLMDVWLLPDPTYNSVYFQNSQTLEEAYATAYKQGFKKGWGSATAQTTHSYDLSGTYPFSKIEGLDFYGDWPSKPLAMGVAYYECYDDIDTRYYHFDRESTSELLHNASLNVIKDGYAILSSSNTSMTITVNGKTNTFPAKTTDDKYKAGSVEYLVYWLTDAQMAAAEAYAKQSGQFYVPVTVTQDGATHTFYFNPNVAKSQVNSAENHTYTASSSNVCTTCGNAADHELHLPISKEMLIRSARQFAQLSEMTNFLTADYQYIQQLNIDASTYLWADKIENLDQYVQVSSIGTTEKPFNASYRGLYIDPETLAEKQYKLSGFKPVEAGLFGVIGQDGVVAELIVECGDVTVGTIEQNVPKFENVAVLAGDNSGILDNVELSLNGDVSLTASGSAGLLAGRSSGSIIDCDVTVDNDKTVTITAPNVGGMIGYAAGTAKTETTLTNSNVTLGRAFYVSNALNAGGFIGKAEYLRADRMNAALTSMNAEAGENEEKDPVFYAGGLAGYAADSSFTGVVTGADGNPPEVSISGQMTAPGFCAAGAVGCGSNTTLTAVDAVTNGISGSIAAGYLGSGTNTDVSNSFVTVSGNLAGTDGAAGAAGTIGSQSVFSYVPVTLDGVTIESTDGSAAGYALEIKGEADVFNSPVILGEYNAELTDGKKMPNVPATITAAQDAAGYACVINGTVGDTSVTGPAAITGSNAAGFAVTINGAVNLAHVSPALTADAAGYMHNSNANLTVSGSTAAAGFALTIGEDATVDNSYTLCTITSGGTVTIEAEVEETTETTEPSEAAEPTESTNPTDATDPVALTEPTEEPTEIPTVDVAAVYGFAGTNNGAINRCMANVDTAGVPNDDIADGFGFVGFNNGLVTTSYGWYNSLSSDRIVTKFDGNCYSSYFADMNSEYVEIYNDDGDYELAVLDDLNNKELKGFTNGYNSCPYSAKIKPENYPYLMLRDHYGNWYTPPQYAYGVAYYEFYEDGTMAVHLWDLSDVDVTVEDEPLPEYVHADGLDSNPGSEKIIDRYGYAVFRKESSDTGVLSELSGAEIVGLDYISEKNVTYKFYELNESDTGIVSIPTTAFSSTTATVDTRFANAVNVKDNSYEVRTPEQLANVVKLADANGKVTATFKQTHSITLKQVTNSDGTAAGSNSFTVIDDFSGAYNGGGFTISVADGNTWMSTVNGTVQDLNVAVTDSFSAPIFGTVKTASGDEKTPVYALSGIAVTAGEQVTEVPGALLAGTVNAGSTVSGCSVTVGTVTTEAGSFGGLVTTNAGTLSGNTVTIESLTANGSAVVGGLNATNSGTIIGNSKVVNVNILYTNGSGAAIGGLVGENITVTVDDSTCSGTISGAAVSGSINRGDTADGIYKIGGVIGNMTGGSAEQSTSTVTVSKDWANEDTADVTFGSSGITNNGPVGMFVGYAGDVTLTNCSSTAANDTYQFLGQAKVDTLALTNTWKSSVKSETAVKAYDDSVTDGVYTSYSPSGISFSAAANAFCVATDLDDCFFCFGEDNMEQSYDVKEYYYTHTSNKENKYTIGNNLVVPNINTENKTFLRSECRNKEYIETGKYYLKDGKYYLASVKYSEDGSVVGIPINPKFALVETGNESNILISDDADYNAGKARYEYTFTLHSFAQAQLNGNYIAVNANGNALDSQGNEYTIPTSKVFEQRDTMYVCVWNGSGNTITNVADSTVYTMIPSIDLSGTPVMSYNVNGAIFNLCPLSVTNNGSSYSVMTFTYQNNANYQRQFITSIPVTAE